MNKTSLPSNPTVEQAVEYMKTSTDILDWNQKRAEVRDEVGIDAFIKNGYTAAIDCAGLCPMTLNPEKVAMHKASPHKPFFLRRKKGKGKRKKKTTKA